MNEAQRQAVEEIWEDEGHAYLPTYSQANQEKALSVWLEDIQNYDTVSVLSGGLNPFDMEPEELLMDYYDSIEYWLEKKFLELDI